MLRIITCSAAVLLLSCAKKPAASSDTVAAATDRLQGNWRVEKFAPDSPLEPPLQSLLDAQLGAMTLAFTGSSFSASGPGLNIAGNYKVWSAGGDQFSGTIYDSGGVGYRVAGQFNGPALDFRSFDAPWQGQGRLVR